MWNANLMQQGNFIHIFSDRHVSGTYPHHQGRCVGRVYGADGAVHSTICTVHTTHAAALKTIIHPKTRCRKPYAAAQHLMLPVMGVCTRNMSI